MEAVGTVNREQAERYAEELAPWLAYVSNTGGNPIIDLLVDKTPVQINAPRAMIAATVKCQVQLLHDLHLAGLLKERP